MCSQLQKLMGNEFKMFRVFVKASSSQPVAFTHRNRETSTKFCPGTRAKLWLDFATNNFPLRERKVLKPSCPFESVAVYIITSKLSSLLFNLLRNKTCMKGVAIKMENWAIQV